MKPSHSTALGLAWAWLACGPLALAQHAHINAGALGGDAANQLSFINGANFRTDSGYFVPLTAADTGPLAGKYQGSISFTALAATPNAGGPAFGHAALGARLILEVASVAGPVGAEFGVWEEDEATGAMSLRFTALAGLAGGTNSIALSENDGARGTDPFGHIHGRHFTVSAPGLYTVGFRIADVSGNGPGGAPLHAPSDIFPLYFQAGTSLASISVETNLTRVAFGALMGRAFHLESTASLTAPVPWQRVAGPIPGANRLVVVEDANTSTGPRFYRLRAEQP